MVRMKILFIVCVFSFITQTRSDEFIREHLERINFKNLHEYFPDTDTITRDIEIESGQSTDINSQQPGTFEYYKSIVLLYCQVLNYKFLNGQRPKWPVLSELDNLKDAKTDVPDESAITKPKSSSKPSAIKSLLNITYNLLLHYDALIQPIGHLERAFYFNALQWLQLHIKTDQNVGGLIAYIKSSQKKARNYLNEFVPWEKFDKFFNYHDERFKKLDGWLKFDNECDVALAFLIDMLPSEGKAANDIPMRVTDMEAYEYILMHAEPRSFYYFMKIEIWDGIRIVDNIFHQRSKIDHSINDPYTKGILINDINMTELKRGTVQYYKHLTTLFIAALEISFNVQFLPEPLFNQLAYYPERDDELYNEPEVDDSEEFYQLHEDQVDMPTRYCALQRWIGSVVLDSIRKTFEKMENIPKMIDRLYLHRLMQWFLVRFSENNHKTKKCNDVLATGILLRNFLKEKWPAVEVAKNEIGKPQDRQILLNANIIDDLLITEFGANHDRIMGIMLCVTLAELAGFITEYKAKIEFLNSAPMDEEERARATDTALNDGNNAIRYMRVLLTFGDFDAEVICTSIDFYADYILGMDEGDFLQTFVMDRHAMLDAIELQLNKHCSTPQSPKDHDTETSPHSSHQNNNNPGDQENIPQHGPEHQETRLQHSPEYYGHKITPPKLFHEIEHDDKKSPKSDDENNQERQQGSPKNDHEDGNKTDSFHDNREGERKGSPENNQKSGTQSPLDDGLSSNTKKDSKSPPQPLFDGTPPDHLPKLRIRKR